MTHEDKIERERVLSQAWMPRTTELLEHPHFLEQAARAYEAYRPVHGTKGAMDLEDFFRHLAQLVALVEVTGNKRTGNNGGVIVERGPMEGYAVYLHVADVFAMHLAGTSDDPGGDLWDRVMGYWQQAPPAKKVWTLSVVDATSLVTTMHQSEAAAIQALRDNYDPEGDLDGIVSKEIAATLTVQQGLTISIDEHVLEDM